MLGDAGPVLVFGATGQQGGAVARALLAAGRPVRAFVRDPGSAGAVALRRAGAELVRGDLSDTSSLRVAMAGVHGVFSVQPSSPDPRYGVSDEEEVRYGIRIADLAAGQGVRHLVYSSVDALGRGPTGMGHFDSKARIEAHVRALPIAATVVRPAAFMEMLLMPGFGLDTGRFNFFMRPEQPMQLLAIRDLGTIVAEVFADPARFAGATFGVASDAVTGDDLAAAFTEAAGRPIAYARFADDVLAANPLLAGLTALLDDGPLAGSADLEALRALHPGLMSLRDWLALDATREAFHAALGAPGAWRYRQA